MTFISRVPLYNIWFGHRLNGTSPNTNRLHRICALESVASAMVQLDQFLCQTGGRLLFESNDSPSGTGPMRLIDHKAMLDRWFVLEDPDEEPIYIECAASNDPKAYYTLILNEHPEQNQVLKGLPMLLRQLISWIPLFLLIQTLTSRISLYLERVSSKVSLIGMVSLFYLVLLAMRDIPGSSRATGTRLCTLETTLML